MSAFKLLVGTEGQCWPDVAQKRLTGKVTRGALTDVALDPGGEPVVTLRLDVQGGLVVLVRVDAQALDTLAATVRAQLEHLAAVSAARPSRGEPG